MKLSTNLKPEDLSVNVENVDATQRRLTVTVGATRVQEALAHCLEEVGRSVRIKGFRAGKAPTAMVKKMYGKEIEAEAVHHLIDDSFHDALQKAGVKAVGQPKISDFNFSENNPFSYVATVEIFPDIQLQKYKGLSLALPDLEINDDDVEKSLESLRDSHSELVPLTVARPVQLGDFAIINYTGKILGQILLVGASQEMLPDLKGENMTVEIGKGALIPGFEDRLMGGLPGEEKEFTLKFPEPLPEELEKMPADHPARKLAGRDIQYSVKIIDIKAKVLPELNDDFARDLGKFKSLDELRGEVRKDLERIADENKNRMRRHEVVRALIDSNPCDVPQAFVDHEVHHFIADLHNRHAGQRQPNADEENYYRSLAEEYRPQAERRVKGALLLNAVAEAEALAVTDSDVEQYLQRLSAETKRPFEEIRRFYENPERRESISL